MLSRKEIDELKIIENGEKWRLETGYNASHRWICLNCIFFRQYRKDHDYGDCGLKKEAGAFPGIEAWGVCNGFINYVGLGRNGRAVDPALMPRSVFTRKKDPCVFYYNKTPRKRPAKKRTGK